MLQRIKQLQAASQCYTVKGDASRDDMEVREGRVWVRERVKTKRSAAKRRRRLEHGLEGVGQSLPQATLG